jgi:excisionase family DNA binding protein
MITHPETEKPIGALKVTGAAKYLNVTPATVRRLVGRGLLKPNRALRHWIFAVDELDRFLHDAVEGAGN